MKLGLVVWLSLKKAQCLTSTNACITITDTLELYRERAITYAYPEKMASDREVSILSFSLKNELPLTVAVTCPTLAIGPMQGNFSRPML